MVERAQRYPSDITVARWAVIEPLLPQVNTGGRPERHPRRAIVDAILYVVRTGCAWRQLPADFPPRQTVYWYFNRWEEARATEKILPIVREQLRLAERREQCRTRPGAARVARSGLVAIAGDTTTSHRQRSR